MADDPATRDVRDIHELMQLVAPRSDADARHLILRAYEYAEHKHRGVTRTSGEPYITHPLAVAGSLATLRLDAATIAAALLHDVIEDCNVTLEQMRDEFGPEITQLVDSVTKLSKREGLQRELAHATDPSAIAAISEGSSLAFKTNREAESLRKMFLGITKDVRVVLIKLADRMHNMRTIAALRPEKRARIARETLEIFAPLANRLGMWDWKQQLEEMGFHWSKEDVYNDLANRLDEGAAERDATVNRQIARLRGELADRGITNVYITGRAKQIYSIWRKMQRKKCTFDQIMDLRAIRVIVEDDEAGVVLPADLDQDPPTDDLGLPSIPLPPSDQTAAEESEAASVETQKAQRRRDIAAMQCYNVLYVVHNMWTPIAAEFDDYIAKPKDNHYRSLHTAVIADDGKSLEVQIRTRSMHRAAEFGVAAHWLYKESAVLTADYQRYLDAWREDLRAISNAEDDASEFVSSAMRESELDDNIYCFTPKGKLIELPRGATVLDFAFHVHTDLGYKCRGAYVNSHYQPISHKLKNDDQVDVVTRNDSAPARDWFYRTDEYVATASAKAKIKLYFKRLDRAVNIVDGRELIDREIRRMGAETELKFDDVLKLYKVETKSAERVDDFVASVGAGTVTVRSISSRILEELNRREREKLKQSPVGYLPNLLRRKPAPNGQHQKAGFFLQGSYDIPAQPASCCTPLPGDDVIGYVTIGQGVKAHRSDCKNIASLDSNRIIAVEYIGEMSETYPIQFLVSAVDRPGLLNELSGVLSDSNINIIACNILNRNQKLGETNIWFKVEMRNAGEAVTTMSKLQRVRNVFEVTRVTSAKPR